MTGRPCGGPRWLGASSGAGERQAVPVMVPGGWYCTGGGAVGALALLVLCWGGCGEPWLHWYCAGGYGEPWLCWYCAGGLWGALASLVLCWGTVWSPGFVGTVLGAVGSPAFTGTVLTLASLVLCWGLWGALASLVLCWGAVGSPGFVGTVLGDCVEPWLCWYCAGGCGEPWLHWYCARELWGALALLVLCWGAVGSPGFTGKLRNKFLKFPECSNHSKYCFTIL